jgi:hypothetical protein
LAIQKGWFNPYLFASARRPVIPRTINPDVVFCHGPFEAGDYDIGQTLLAQSSTVVCLSSDWILEPATVDRKDRSTDEANDVRNDYEAESTSDDAEGCKPDGHTTDGTAITCSTQQSLLDVESMSKKEKKAAIKAFKQKPLLNNLQRRRKLLLSSLQRRRKLLLSSLQRRRKLLLNNLRRTGRPPRNVKPPKRMRTCLWSRRVISPFCLSVFDLTEERFGQPASAPQKVFCGTISLLGSQQSFSLPR